MIAPITDWYWPRSADCFKAVSERKLISLKPGVPDAKNVNKSMPGSNDGVRSDPSNSEDDQCS
jgi:hypothetical protein